MTGVEVRGVAKSFGATPVLRGVDLTVPAGRLVAVLGPSGCGKTTLLRVVAGFERADAGEVTVDGRLLSGPGVHVAPHRRRVAVVPQEGALFPHLSVAANVGFGLPRAARRGPRVPELLELAGLAGLERRMPHELSGGQQQRVAVARALAASPAVVLLDEPFSGLDATLRGALRDEVRRLLRAAGSTAVLVTHDQEEALSLADSVAVVRDGRVVQQAPPDELYARPVDLGVATFVGEANVLAGEATGDAVAGPLGRAPVAGAVAPGPVAMVVRPEHLRLGAGVPATVLDRRFFGHDAMLTLRLRTGERLLVRTPAASAPATGADVEVGIAGPVLCFPGPGVSQPARAAEAFPADTGRAGPR